MTDDEYTPSLKLMRAHWTHSGGDSKLFDRRIEQVRAEAKAEALNEYAETLGHRISGAIRKYGQAQGDFRDIIQELRDRANQYKEEQ